MTDKLDAATIRELLAQCEAGVMLSAQTGALLARAYLELSDKEHLLNAEIKRLQGERNASVVYGAELYDQLQSQAAELERLRAYKAEREQATDKGTPSPFEFQ
jgi:hypothetical protein